MQQGAASPFARAQAWQAASGGAVGPAPLPLPRQPLDLDAQQQLSPAGQQPLSPRLSLQPSWQASLASRAALDYGEL